MNSQFCVFDVVLSFWIVQIIEAKLRFSRKITISLKPFAQFIATLELYSWGQFTAGFPAKFRRISGDISPEIRRNFAGNPAVNWFQNYNSTLKEKFGRPAYVRNFDWIFARYDLCEWPRQNAKPWQRSALAGLSAGSAQHQQRSALAALNACSAKPWRRQTLAALRAGHRENVKNTSLEALFALSAGSAQRWQRSALAALSAKPWHR